MANIRHSLWIHKVSCTEHAKMLHNTNNKTGLFKVEQLQKSICEKYYQTCCDDKGFYTDQPAGQ